MSGFTQQLTLLKSGEYNNVYPNSSWTLQDYKDMMESIGKMEITQNMGAENVPAEVFILNPDYVETEEDDECEVCDTKTKTTIKTYGCMDMSVCKNCEEPDDDDKYDHPPDINSDQLDTALCHDRFNWSFDKPTEEEGKYTTIYITHFDKDQ
tara:strand:+ start:697 stop:1152 length:456 start_codon:yes stop_codon:yes gene_type:complete